MDDLWINDQQAIEIIGFGLLRHIAPGDVKPENDSRVSDFIEEAPDLFAEFCPGTAMNSGG
jgi:hypothetical protein